MKKYYDPEYDRIVDESVPRKQYEWFKGQSWFHKIGRASCRERV